MRASVKNDEDYTPEQKLLLREFTHYMAVGLRAGELDVRGARDASRVFLPIIELVEPEEVKEKLSLLVEAFECFRPVLIAYLHHEEEKMIRDVLGTMRNHLQKNRVDEAIRVAVASSEKNK